MFFLAKLGQTFDVIEHLTDNSFYCLYHCVERLKTLYIVMQRLHMHNEIHNSECPINLIC